MIGSWVFLTQILSSAETLCLFMPWHNDVLRIPCSMSPAYAEFSKSVDSVLTVHNFDLTVFPRPFIYWYSDGEGIPSSFSFLTMPVRLSPSALLRNIS